MKFKDFNTPEEFIDFLCGRDKKGLAVKVHIYEGKFKILKYYKGKNVISITYNYFSKCLYRNVLFPIKLFLLL